MRSSTRRWSVSTVKALRSSTCYIGFDLLAGDNLRMRLLAERKSALAKPLIRSRVVFSTSNMPRATASVCFRRCVHLDWRHRIEAAQLGSSQRSSLTLPMAIPKATHHRHHGREWYRAMGPFVVVPLFKTE